MYNIHNHYNNIYSLAKSIVENPQLIYMHPFGASNTENIEVLAKQSSSPVKVSLICYDQEPLLSNYNRPLFSHIIKESVWGPYQILVNTELDSDEKNAILREYELSDCYYFHHAFATLDWYRGYQFLNDLVAPKDRILHKKFITFNRITSNARIYRSLLINELITHDIINQGHASFGKISPDGTTFDSELISHGNSIGLDPTLINQTINNISSTNHSLVIDSPRIPNSSFEINAIPENMESFLHIVTETCYWGRKKHLTEKIFKPIVMRQPFVLVGCAHNLEYLKSYGFKTFDRWWDESYDQIENDVERLSAVGQLVANICSNSLSDLTDMLHDMSEVLEYNRNWFYSQEFLNLIWSELKTNLHFAITTSQEHFF